MTVIDVYTIEHHCRSCVHCCTAVHIVAELLPSGESERARYTRWIFVLDQRDSAGKGTGLAGLCKRSFVEKGLSSAVEHRAERKGLRVKGNPGSVEGRRTPGRQRNGIARKREGREREKRREREKERWGREKGRERERERVGREACQARLP